MPTLLYLFIHQVLEKQTSSTIRLCTGSSWFLHVPDPVPVRDRNTTEIFLLQTGSRHRELLILSAPVPEPVSVRLQTLYLAAGSTPVPDPVPGRMKAIYLAAGSSS